MAKVKPVLGYSAAALTVVAAVLIPFLLIDLFTRGVASTGVRVAPSFTGGEASHTIDRGTYRIVVNRPVRKTAPLERLEPFVQMTWTPLSALPERVLDPIDIDGDGRPDAVVAFEVPRDTNTPVRAEITALTPVIQPVGSVTRESFSSVIARVGDSVVVRLPLRQ
jgi:hypothetical protein